MVEKDDIGPTEIRTNVRLSIFTNLLNKIQEFNQDSFQEY